MKRITKKPWFGPRELFGWGWSPITWQGWVLIFLFIVLELYVVTYLVQYGVIYSFIGSFVLICTLFILITITGDKPNFVGIKGKK